MNQRRDIRSKKLGSATTHRRLRLVIEPLEARRLLAGIHVSVYVDQNGSRDYQPASDVAAADRLVYVDSNGNGAYDLGEPFEVTDSDGMAYFDQIDRGNYAVGLLGTSESQRQTAPVMVDTTATAFSATGGAQLLATPNLETIWVIDEENLATIISGAEPNQDVIDLGGEIVASIALNDSETMIVVDRADGAQQTQLVNLRSGDLSTPAVAGLSSQDRVVEFVWSGENPLALIRGTAGNRLAPVTVSQTTIDFAAGFSVAGNAVASNAGVGQLAVLSENLYGQQLSLVDAADGSLIDSLQLAEIANSVSATADGTHLLVEMVGGGVHAVAIGPNGLSLAAILSEAQAPLYTELTDGRIVSASRSDASELIVWDTGSWAPAGRTKLPDSTRVAGKAQLRADRRGDRLVVVHAQGVHSVDLSVADSARVHVADSTDIVHTSLGVSVDEDYTPPDILPLSPTQVTEDTSSELDLRSAVETSATEQDSLWFSLGSPPSYGSAEVTPEGVWHYTPDPDYSGNDALVLLVHDGQSTTELAVVVEVTPVNDPPMGISVDAELSEDVEIGEHVGYVSIVDVDRDAAYEVTTSDSRFTVSNGRIFISDADFDYETEDSLIIEVLATDLANPEISIWTQATVTIRDVNEAPTSLRLSSTQLPEEVSGAEVGTVIVEDEDANSQYDYSVSDPRFIVLGDKLQLLQGHSVDYEQEPEVVVEITAVDREYADHQISDTITLTVLNQNDAPTGIRLSSPAVEADRAGAIVGELTVIDPDGDHFQFTVSDSRFEVVGTTLQLRSDQQVAQAQQQIALTINAVAASGDQVSEDFTLAVTPPKPPYQNPHDQHDVNGDGIISPIDVLILINLLNAEGGGFELPEIGGQGGAGENPVDGYPDVNGDGFLSPIDALLIINFLNNSDRNDGASEGEWVESGPAPSAYGPQLPDQFAFPIVESDGSEEARRIDAELEVLIDQLSRGKHL